MSKRLYVGNLLAKVTSEDLRKLFCRFGTVISAEIAVDHFHQKGRSLGFGFVDMADGADAAIQALDGSTIKGLPLPLVVNEAEKWKPQQDRFSEIMDRNEACYDRRESKEYHQVVQDLKELAESGHIEAAEQLAEFLSFQGPYFDPATAYKWYYIALSRKGHKVAFEDLNHTPAHYCGPVGDFRNESMVSGLVDILGFEKIRSLDAEAARWLAEHDLKGNSG
jgi:hypothetical protein